MYSLEIFYKLCILPVFKPTKPVSIYIKRPSISYHNVSVYLAMKCRIMQDREVIGVTSNFYGKCHVLHILFSTGSHILNVEVPKDQIYPMKLKGISICFSMLKAALCGNYVNFGVFRLYGDEALDNALNTFVKLLLSIPQSDLLV